VNRRLEVLSGFDRSEILGLPVEILIPDSLREAHVRLRESYFREPRNRPMGTGIATRLRRSDGSELPVEIELCPAEVESEPKVIAAVRDVADRKQAEGLIREREDLLRRVGEREDLGRRLHEESIHELFGIGLGLQALATTVNDLRTREAVEEAVEHLDQAIVGLRRLVHDLGSESSD